MAQTAGHALRASAAAQPGRQAAAPWHRRRLVVAAVIVASLLFVVGILVVPAAVAAGADSGQAGATTVAEGEPLIVVSEGETLWGLAPDGVDRQAWAAAVARHNDVDPAELRPGQPLRVPAEAGR